MSNDNFIRITPFIRVPDINAALDFFIDILGFQVGLREGPYAYVWRETAAIRLSQRPGEVLTPGVGGLSYYIDVRDVDALFVALGEKLATLPEGHVVAPRESHGQRELSIMAPDGNWLTFGQQVDASGVGATFER